jgi:hypothetical protein
VFDRVEVFPIGPIPCLLEATGRSLLLVRTRLGGGDGENARRHQHWRRR